MLLCLLRCFVGISYCEPFIESVLVLFPMVFLREISQQAGSWQRDVSIFHFNVEMSSTPFAYGVL